MNILFISRSSLFSNPGGDTIQVAQTAENLKNLDVNVDIRLADETIDYSHYDLIHFFNIIRPADILYHAKRAGKPYVVSTIFVDYTESEMKNASSTRKFISHIFSADGIEYLKVLARFLKNGEKIASRFYILNGHRKSVEKAVSKASMLLPNSSNEYKRLKQRYEIDRPFKVIPNGIDTSIFNGGQSARKRNTEQVLCVARIEPLKNQLNLIKAINNTQFSLLLIGRYAANHKSYYEACREAAGKNIHFMDYLPQIELLKFYQEAKVHALPSWFETTGLSTLESAVSGCNTVITDKGDTREYYRDYAYYCDPDSVESILNAVTIASSEPVNPEYSRFIKSHYTWQIAAEKTLQAYREVLGEKSNHT